ncbi:hypothetical protein D1007_20557 [Hordeum vulgare]|nr:hypothetical protein D1007_20557 [Hordeum vulgare]
MFNRMLATGDDETANRFIIEIIIFEGGAGAAAYARCVGAAAFNPDETQSQDRRPPFMHSTFDQVGMDDPFIQDQVGMENTFPLDHKFSKDYGLEEEDEVDTDGEPLLEDELSTMPAQTRSAKASRRRHTRSWRTNSFAFRALEAFKDQHDSKSFNLTHYWMVIKEEEKFKMQYVATKDTRKEKCRQDNEEQMNAFMEIQRRRLELDAEKQAKMLEMDAEKQAKMLEIEAAMPRPRQKKWRSLA